MSWATEELVSADLGDVRRNRRLVSIVEDLAASPESSVPLASRDRAVERSECWDLVLAIQDTTKLDYSRHRSKRGLGYLRGAETKGVLLHSVKISDN